jgi:NADPH-dependent ferric siderophore reductase
MIGDETALPCFARRLEEMPSQSKSILVIEVKDESHRIEFRPSGSTSQHWVYRRSNAAGTFAGLNDALSKIDFPAGDYYAWIAAEKSCSMQLRDALISSKAAQADWIHAVGYWHY